MHRVRPLVLVLLAMLPACAVPRATPPGGPPSALRVEGRSLVDASGRAVTLRGVNYHRFLDVPDGGWDAPGAPLYSGMGRWDPGTVRTILEGLRDRGFNAVRFHTVAEWWKEDPSSYRDPYRAVTYALTYRDMMEETVRLAGGAGLYVVFDLYAMRNVDGRQSGQESLPWPPWGRHPGVVADRAAFAELWGSIAERLGRHPHVLFELYNEPHGDAKAEEEWFRFVREVLPVIRSRSANPVIVQWDYMAWVNLDHPPPAHGASTLDWTSRHPLGDRNVVYGTHLYRNSGGGGPGSVHRGAASREDCWRREDLEKGLRLMGFDGVERPLLVTEIGAFRKVGPQDRQRELDWLANMLSLLDERGIGYMGWAWASDEQIDHGMLHGGEPNEAGRVLIRAVQRAR